MSFLLLIGAIASLVLLGYALADLFDDGYHRRGQPYSPPPPDSPPKVAPPKPPAPLSRLS